MKVKQDFIKQVIESERAFTALYHYWADQVESVSTGEKYWIIYRCRTKSMIRVEKFNVRTSYEFVGFYNEDGERL